MSRYRRFPTHTTTLYLKLRHCKTLPCKLCPLISHQSVTLKVSLKTFHSGDATLEEQSEFLREIELMKNVGYHRNIISMVACCTKEEHAFLVVEFAKHGDLLNVLREKRKTVSAAVVLFGNTINMVRGYTNQ